VGISLIHSRNQPPSSPHNGLWVLKGPHGGLACQTPQACLHPRGSRGFTRWTVFLVVSSRRIGVPFDYRTAILLELWLIIQWAGVVRGPCTTPSTLFGGESLCSHPESETLFSLVTVPRLPIVFRSISVSVDYRIVAFGVPVVTLINRARLATLRL
jgi:hypothetical protein